jgi:hypothetical protein
MRKLFLIVLVGLLFFSSIVFAQSNLKLSAVNVQFWPEYDKPDMLVISYIMLAPETSFPTTVDLRIPANVESPLVVAVGPTFDDVTDQGTQFTTQTDGDWTVVSIQATGPAIQFEYYDPNLNKNGKFRSYRYEWINNYEVQNFALTVQKPFDATNLNTSIELQDEGIHTDQLQYFSSDVMTLAAGETFLLDISYEKPTDEFSVSQLNLEPVDVGEDTPGRVSLNNYTPYLLGGAALILVVGGFYYYLRIGNDSKSKKSRRRKSSRVETEDNPEESYCPQCGTRAKSGDRFCRVCGGRLRHTEE